jgi:hypothetical protein
MEHLIYACDHYSAKIWALLSRALMLSLSMHTGECGPAIDLTHLEMVFNKPHPSLLLHLLDSNTQKDVILLLQKFKRDIIFRHVQLQVPRRQENYNSAYKPIYSLQSKKSKHF